MNIATVSLSAVRPDHRKLHSRYTHQKIHLPGSHRLNHEQAKRRGEISKLQAKPIVHAKHR
jgi:hypothetical protein